MLQGKALLATFKMKAYEWVEVAELQSTQEEADTRFLLHVPHAAKTGSKAVTFTSEDTDVVLLCLAFQKDIHCPIIISEVWDTEPHTICLHQQTGLVIGRQRL